jgi:hypothetical protein
MIIKEILTGLRRFRRGQATMAAATVIEVTAGEVTEILKRQDGNPDERATVTIECELMPGRRESREVEPLPPG